MAKIHPVDQVPPFGKLSVLSLQHVLSFYAGAVIVPILIASSLGLSQETTIHLINADLFTCGLATLIQSVGVTWWVGARLPIIQGVTTTAVTPIIAIGLAATEGKGGDAGLPLIYGAIIIAGLFTFLVAPYFVKLLRFFPPVVTGTVLLIMGTSLLAVSANDFVGYAEGTPPLRTLAYGFGTLLVIVLAQRFLKGFLGTIAVLIGLLLGTGVAWALGDLDPDKVTAIGSSASLGVTTPFYFGLPAFSATACLSMIIVMCITMVETTGDTFAVGEIVGKRITGNTVAAAIRADGVSTLLGGILNSFPYTFFAQNVGLVRITRVKSRWVASGAAVIMIILGVIPKAGAVVATIPSPVLGGASLALFANVAWVGLQTIAKSDLRDNRNAVIVTTSLALAMLVTFKPEIAQAFPHWAQVFFSSGMVMGATVAILLNLLFFHVGKPKQDVVRSQRGEGLTIEEINAMDKSTFVSTFSHLFNSATWPVERAWERRPFADVADLRGAFQEAVLTASSEEQRDLVRAYPGMAQLVSADEDEAARISQDIGAVAIGTATDIELRQLDDLEQHFQEKFGTPYVAYLSPTDTPASIIARGVARLENSPVAEQAESLTQVVRIANDRFDQQVRAADPVAAAWEAKWLE